MPKLIAIGDTVTIRLYDDREVEAQVTKMVVSLGERSTLRSALSR